MKLIKKNLFSALIFALIVGVSITNYLLLPLEKEHFDRLIIQCLLVSQLLGFINVIIYNSVSSKKKLSLAVGGYTSSVLYIVISFALSILFSIYYRFAEKTYLIIISVLTVAFIIASVLIYTIGKVTAMNATKVEKSNASFKKLEYIIESICRNNENSDYNSTFNKILEAIKSCDQSSYIDTDNKIYEYLEYLDTQIHSDSTNKVKIDENCEKIFALIKQRTSEVSALKLGGI